MRVVPVVAGILWRGPCFLAVRRPEGKPRAGFWEFPGGKLEAGETPEEARARELDEELGVLPLRIRLWRVVRHDYPDLAVELHFFHVLEFDGEPVSREGHEPAWMTRSEALTLPFLEADLPLVADLPDVAP